MRFTDKAASILLDLIAAEAALTGQRPPNQHGARPATTTPRRRKGTTMTSSPIRYRLALARIDDLHLQAAQSRRAKEADIQPDTSSPRPVRQRRRALRLRRVRYALRALV